MKTGIHACFDSKEAVMRAVESLLRHGISVEEISLILPQPAQNHGADGAVPSNLQSEVAACENHVSSAVVVGGEEGVGVGIGLGLLMAMCIPGIGMFAGSGPIVASLVAAGAVIGGSAGSIYGYLVARDTPHGIAEAMADHITSGGATLSVMESDSLGAEAIVRIVEGVGGRVIAPTDAEKATAP